MYVPAAFAETDRDRLDAFVEQNSFGLLVSQAGGEPFASHLPFLLDRSSGPNGALLGHLALANPQWRQADGQTVLAVFAGPHAYVSPAWYEAENVVPTWNYVAVHVYGTLHVVRDPEALGRMLHDLVRRHESSAPRPWTYDAGAEFFRQMAKAVVGLRVEISRMEGKWKLNQNRPREQRERVVRALRTFAGENERAVADLMQQGLESAP